MGGFYGYRDARDRSDDIFSNIAIGRYGFAGSEGDPFVDPYNTSVGADGTFGEIGSMLLDVVMLNTLGMRNPFRMPSWSEPNAGELGAYAYGRFADNAKSMGAAVRRQKLQSRRAFGKALTGFGRAASQNDPERQKFFDDLESSVASDESGLSDMAIGVFQSVFGLEDYGLEGIRAAQRGEALMLSRLDQSGVQLLRGDKNTLSNNWKSRVSGAVADYSRAAHNIMYGYTDAEGNRVSSSFVKDEDFMRGFDVTDVSSVLEQVAATAGQGEDLGARFDKVGREAIKTLEAFRDLFGDAEAAKKMLNQITGGGWSGMTAESLKRITAETRGLQALGTTAGLSHTAVGNMLVTGMAGVQQGMGYSAAEVASGYVSAPLVEGISSRFLANELANLPDGGANLNPIEIQKLQARANWRAIQFSGSSANKAMTAMVYGTMTGQIDDDTRGRIEELFRSGDRNSMSSATDMIASALGIRREDIFNDTTYKVFADAVGNDPAKTAELLDLGMAAAATEDRTTMERTLADTSLDIATNRARESGVSTQDVKKTANSARLAEIRKSLSDHTEVAGSEALLALMNKAVAESALRNEDEAAQVDAALKVFDTVSKNLGDQDFVAMVRTNSTAAAADAVNERHSFNELSEDAYLSLGTDAESRVLDIINKHGGTAGDNGRIRAADARKILKSIQDSGVAAVDSDAAKIVQKALDNGSDAAVVDALNQLAGDGGLLSEESVSDLVFGNTTFVTPPLDATPRSSTYTSRMLADDIRKNGITVTRRYFGGTGHLEAEDKGLAAEGAEAILASYSDALFGEDQEAQDRFIKKHFDDAKEAEDGHYKSEKAEAFKTRVTDLRNKFEAAKAGGDDEAMKDAFNELNALMKSDEYADIFGDDALKERADQAVGDITTSGGGKAFAGTDSSGLVGVMSSDTGFVDVVDIGGKTYRRDANFDSLIKKAAETAGLEGFQDIEGVDLYKKIGELSDEDREKFLKSLEENGGTVLAASEADLDSVLGKVATANVADSGFGGSLVAADEFTKSLKKIDGATVVTSKYLEDLGQHIQDLVDENAPAAYMTMQQAVLKGLETGNLDDALDSMFKSGTAPEEKQRAINKIKQVLKDFHILNDDGSVNANWKEEFGKNEDEIVAAFDENEQGAEATPTVTPGEPIGIAKDDGAKQGDNAAGSALAGEGGAGIIGENADGAQGERGSSSDNPIYVSIVPGCSVEVDEGGSAVPHNPGG